MRYGFLISIPVILFFGVLFGCGSVVPTEEAALQIQPRPALEGRELIRVLVVNGVRELEVEGVRGGAGPLHVSKGFGGNLVVNGKVYAPPLKFSPERDFIYIDKIPYRGTIEVTLGPDGVVQVIDELPLENYLVGLINSEISSKWPVEALKAQAVIARTYAVYQKRARSGSAFHLTNTNMDQVYSGAHTEDLAALRAVEETAGEILAYRGEPALTLYHSNAGGRTESAKDVWAGDYPYLKAVKSPFDRGAPNFQWEFAASSDTLTGLLVRAGYDIGEPVRIKVKERSPTGRVKEILILDSSGRRLTLSGEELRKALGYAILRSTLFNVKRTRSGFLFKGRGSGHGVGLSQWGAKGMAIKGFDYRSILGHFYHGTSLIKAY
jgi:stage II sporulation protein D